MRNYPYIPTFKSCRSSRLKVFCKKVFLKLSLENTYAGASFSCDPNAGAFQLILKNFLELLFCGTCVSQNACFQSVSENMDKTKPFSKLFSLTNIKRCQDFDKNSVLFLSMHWFLPSNGKPPPTPFQFHWKLATTIESKCE